MNGEEEKKRIRRMNIRYAMLSALLYCGIFIVLLGINWFIKMLMDFDPYVQLLLYIIYFVLDIFLTKGCLHLPQLRRIIYDAGS